MGTLWKPINWFPKCPLWGISPDNQNNQPADWRVFYGHILGYGLLFGIEIAALGNEPLCIYLYNNRGIFIRHMTRIIA